MVIVCSGEGQANSSSESGAELEGLKSSASSSLVSGAGLVSGVGLVIVDSLLGGGLVLVVVLV